MDGVFVSGVPLLGFLCFLSLQAPCTTSCEALTQEHKPLQTACYKLRQSKN